MARIVDHSKLERVHNSAMGLIVEKGYAGASISLIASRAQVSEGYLYRFYKSKEDLVNFLLNSTVEEVTNYLNQYFLNHDSAIKIIEELLNSLCNIVEKNETQMKFIFVMLGSYNFSVAEEVKKSMLSTLEKILLLGIEQNIIDKKIDLDHFFNILIIYPIQFINFRLKEFVRDGCFSQNDKESLVSFITQVLKK